MGLAAETWQTVTWREGSAIDMTSRFARVRVRPAHGDERPSEPRPAEWLLIEWPEGAPQPIESCFSTLPEHMSPVEMVDLTELRWRIERDDQDLRQEVGLGHDEGQGWRGFHHHATLYIAAYGFPISERETVPPSGPDAAPRLGQTPLRAHRRPGGAPATTRTPRPQPLRDTASAPHRRPRQNTPQVPMLPRSAHETVQIATFITQSDQASQAFRWRTIGSDRDKTTPVR